MGDLDRSEKKKRKRDKKDKKDKKEKHKKEKSSKRHKKEHKKESKKARHSSSSSSSDGSGSDAEVQVSSTERLERGRRAVRLVRELLQEFPKLRLELRGLAQQIDRGEVVDLTGLQDEDLKSKLNDIFSSLLLRTLRTGTFKRAPNGLPVMSTIGPVLSEAPSEPSPQPRPAGPSAPTPDPSRTASKKPRPPLEPEDAPDPPDPHEASAARQVGSPAGGDSPPEAMEEQDTGAKAEEEKEEEENEAEAAVVAGPAPAPPRPRTMGPAMPPPDVLAAASAATRPLKDEEEDITIGPPPPAAVAEDEQTPAEARSSEVERILRVQEQDAFAVLDLDPDECEAGDIKKKFWKLSLRVHPDKCDHPRAQEAFHLLKEAQKTLADAGQREVLREKRAQVKLVEVARRLAREQREAAEWRRARGQAPLPGDAEALAGGAVEPKGDVRETWMTELPPEMQEPRAGEQMSQVSVTAFSMKAKVGRGDTSAWTDTPETAKERAAQRYLESYQANLLEDVKGRAEQARAEQLTEMVESYNKVNRPKSLLEQHQEKLKKDKKAKRKKGEATEDWQGNHPWKPWDRDKDLVIKPKGLTAEGIKKKNDTLEGRFTGSSSSGGSKTFG